MWKSTSMRLSRFLAVILIFFTPLLFVTNTNEAFEFPKMYYVYFIGGTLATLDLIRNLLTDKKIIMPNAYVLAFLASQIIATVFSTHLYTSLWGYYSRFNGGLISIIVFISLFYVFVNVHTKEFVERLLRLVILGTLPVSLFALFQHFTLDQATRVYSTIGQPNWLGTYIVVVFPLALTKFLKNNQNKKENIFWLLLLNLIYSSIWFTYSLSSILGLVATLIIYAILERKNIIKEKKKVSILFTIMFCISILSPGVYSQRINDIFSDLNKLEGNKNSNQDLVFNNDISLNSGTEAIKTQENNLNNSSIIQSVKSNNPQISDPGYIRIYLWKGTLDLTTSSVKNLLVGTGPETFPYEFQHFRPKELNYSSEWDFILNKPHNYYLELLSETGILGLGTYLAMIYWILNSIATDQISQR